MFDVKLEKGAVISVSYKNHKFDYSVDGSLPNPLEAFYATLAGCAGVYVKKTCMSLGISDEGVEINVRPFVKNNPLMPEKFVTSLKFPDGFSTEIKQKVMKSVEVCAVKDLVKNGGSISFSVEEVS